MRPAEILRRIRRIEIRTNRLVNETLAGRYHSVFKGMGMEFSEVREYIQGDDVRTIDWNVTSRMGHPYVKKFVEERELTVVLVVDASGSQDFGSGERLKREIASEIGALIAFSAIHNNDRVGLMMFTDQVELWVPPQKGRRHALRVIREILAFEPRGKGTDVTCSLEALGRLLHKRAVVFLISDFLAEGYERALRIANRRHDVIALALSDPLEDMLPPVGLLMLRDAESGERLLVDSSDRAFRERFAEAARDRHTRRQRLLRHARVDVAEIHTDQPYELPLMKLFADRALRARHP